MKKKAPTWKVLLEFDRNNSPRPPSQQQLIHLWQPHVAFPQTKKYSENVPTFHEAKPGFHGSSPGSDNITTANTGEIIPGEGVGDAMHAGTACVLAGKEQRWSDLIFKAKSCFSYLQKILNIRNEIRTLATAAACSQG